MKTTILYTRLFVLALISAMLSSASHEAKRKYVPIDKAMKKGIVSTKLLGAGGYSEECISANFYNSDDDTVFVVVETGRILPSEDSLLQSIILVRQDSIALPPGDSTRHRLYGFCCMATKNAPRTGSRYSMGSFATDIRLVQLAQYLSNNKHEAGAMQMAVWAISNGYNLASITESIPGKQKALREKVAALTNQAAPWYTVIFEEDSSLCSGKPETLVADVEYLVRSNGMVSMVLYDCHYKPTKVFFQYIHHNPKRYTYNIKLDVKGYPSGVYHLKVVQDGTLLANKDIRL